MGEWSEFFEDHPEYAPEPPPPPHPVEAVKRLRRDNAAAMERESAAEVHDLLRKALKDHPPKR